jgi:hypothetical protein
MSKLLGVRTKLHTDLNYAIAISAAHYMLQLAEIMDLLVGSLYTLIPGQNEQCFLVGMDT